MASALPGVLHARPFAPDPPEDPCNRSGPQGPGPRKPSALYVPHHAQRRCRRCLLCPGHARDPRRFRIRTGTRASRRDTLGGLRHARHRRDRAPARDPGRPRRAAAGGNAVDAAIAANALLGLVEPTGCGMGGDLFALVWEAKTKKLHGFNGSGRPRAADPGSCARRPGCPHPRRAGPYRSRSPAASTDGARCTSRLGQAAARRESWRRRSATRGRARRSRR